MNRARILIVEDEVVIALGLGSSLERLGYEVADTVSTGEDAVAKALDLAPDLVLMDIVLAGSMDGVAAARRIREEADIPVIYLSANADAATVERARDTMPYGYLNKPINERDLMTGIDAALQQHGMDRRLRESEEKYRGLVESMTDMVIATDENGTVTYVSPQVKHMTGYEVHEVEGRNFNEFTHPEDRQLLAEMFAAGITGTAQSREYRVLSKGGETIWVRTSGRPTFIGGRFAGVSGVMTDITEWKRAERALAESEEKYRHFMENMSDSLWVLDLKTMKFIYNSPQSVYILGYTPEESKALSPEDVVTPDSLGVVARALADELERDGLPGVDPDRSRMMEIEQIHRDGSIVWCEMTMRFLRDVSGKPDRILGVSRDITDRRRAERALVESEEKFRLLVEHSPFPIALLDNATGRITYSNRTMRDVLAYTIEEVPTLEEWWKAAFPDPAYREKNRLAWEQALGEIARTGAVKGPMDSDVRCGDGSVRRIEFRFTPLGETTAVIMSDVTGKSKPGKK